MSLKPATFRPLNLLPQPRIVMAAPGTVPPQAERFSWRDTADWDWIVLGIPPAAAAAAAANPEGYGLMLWPRHRPQKILMIGDTPRAIRYAEATAVQILERHPGRELPEMLVVVDWPELPVRAALRTLISLREPRQDGYFEDGLKDIGDICKRMVELKLNTYLIHSGWGEGLKALLDEKGRRPPLTDSIVRTAREFDLEVGMICVHDLEVGNQLASYRATYPCGTDPDLRRQRLLFFRKLVLAYPEVRYWIMHNQEHRRCACDRCRKVSFGAEVLDYFHEYYEILREIRPDAVYIVCPYYQIGFPGFHMEYLAGGWRKIGPEIRTYWWTDWYPQQRLPQFLTKVEECFEPIAYDALPKVWHWFYANGLIDFTFPCAEHFQSWIKAGLASGHLEECSAEFAFYRSHEWNMRALAQYTWNSALPPAEFDRCMAQRTWPELPTDAMLALLRDYRQQVTVYLKALFGLGHSWKTAGATPLARRLQQVRRQSMAVTATLKRLQRKTGRKPGRTVTDFLLDLAILKGEAELRLNLRDGYLAWQRAEKRFADSATAAGVREMRDSLRLVKAAQKTWLVLRQNRQARGNWVPDFQAAPVTKLEKIFPDLLMTAELTLKLRRQGYRGYRPRWKEWTEIEEWIWKEYTAFH